MRLMKPYLQRGIWSCLLTSLLYTISWAQSDSLSIADSTPIDQHHSLALGALTLVEQSETSALTFDQMLQGTVAGLSAVSNSGQPGAAVAINVRGPQSFYANTQPLYVVDGFPLTGDNTLLNSGFATGPLLNGLTFLDPQDISSIKVLRSAGAAVNYGSRASGGVVLITTLRGEQDEISIQLSSQIGTQKPINRYDLADANQYAGFLNAGAAQAGLAPPFANPNTAIINTNWQDQVLDKNPLIHQHNLTFRGGDEKFQFSLMGNYSNVGGVLKGSDFERISIRANLDAALSPKLNLSNSLSFGRNHNNTVATNQNGQDGNFGVVAGAYLFSPLLPPTNENGDVIPFNFGVFSDFSISSFLHRGVAVPNPLGLATALQSEATNSRIFDIARLDYEFNDRLKMDASLGFDITLNEESTFLPGALEYDVSLGGRGASAQMQFYRWMQQVTLTYEPALGLNHQLSIVGGVANEGYHRDFLSGVSEGFENEALGFYSLAVGKDKAVNSELTKWGLQSFLANATYSYRRRFELHLGVRADASSTFNNELYLFPSIAGAYRLITSKDSEGMLSKLDLRLGFSQVGNQRIPAYSRFDFLDEFSSSLNGTNLSGISLARPADGQLEMETSHQLNAGISADFFASRLNIEFDLYQHFTNNALIGTQIPSISGFNQLLTNGGEMRNQGIELTVSVRPSQGSIQWESSLMMGLNANEVISLPNQIREQILGPAVAGIADWSILRIGESIGTFYGFVTDGLVQAGEQVRGPSGDLLQPGDQKFRDQNGDGVINGLDRTILGKSLPDATFGLFNYFRWRNFDLSFHLQGLIGHNVANLNSLYLLNPSGFGNVLAEFANGSDALPVANANRREHIFSDAVVENASYLRLQQLRLGFQLPSKMKNHLRLKHAHVFIQGENLWTLTGYSGLDPDVSHYGLSPILQGVDFGGYPRAKIFRAGITIKI